MSNLGKRKEIFRQITAAPKTGRNYHQRLWNTFRELSSNSSGKISGEGSKTLNKLMMKSVCSFFLIEIWLVFLYKKRNLFYRDQWSWLIEWWNQFVVFFRILILSPLNWTHNRIIIGKKTVFNALLFEYLRLQMGRCSLRLKVFLLLAWIRVQLRTW